MSFIDSYKRLEKLCDEVYSDNHGLSAYIDEMNNNPNGAYYVPGWDEDLKQLKHTRWASPWGWSNSKIVCPDKHLSCSTIVSSLAFNRKFIKLPHISSTLH